MKIETFFDDTTFTLTFIAYDEETKDAVVIDPVLDYDPIASQTSTTQLQRLETFIVNEGLKVHYVLETHAHADHLSGSQYLRFRFGAKVAIGAAITTVQDTFKTIFDMDPDFATDGSQFDELLSDGQVIEAGSLKFEVITTPGHTPACLSFKRDDIVFVGDTLFIDDYGTGRCDFPAGSANDLYDSVQKIYALPDATRLFVGHDYQPGGREVMWETTVGKSKQNNPQIQASMTREEFVKLREARDATLSPPRLIFQSVQVNVDAGRIPQVADNGIRYLRIPLNLFGPTDALGEPLKEAAE